MRTLLRADLLRALPGALSRFERDALDRESPYPP
jgi:hypothetical protein